MNEWIIAGMLGSLLAGMIIGQLMTDLHWRSSANRKVPHCSGGRFFWVVEEGR